MTETAPAPPRVVQTFSACLLGVAMAGLAWCVIWFLTLSGPAPDWGDICHQCAHQRPGHYPWCDPVYRDDLNAGGEP